jgi:hypothetical protein
VRFFNRGIIPALLLLAAIPVDGAAPMKAATPTATRSLAIQPIAFPFAPGSMAPYVAADGKGGFVFTWIDRKSAVLHLAQFHDGKWSPARTIPTKDLFVNKSDMPSVTVAGEDLVVQWVEHNGHGIAIRLARSMNGGATWTPPVTPHPAIVSEFGFVSLLPAADGSSHLVWLDGRKLEGGEEGHGDMTLRHASFGADGTVTADHEVDPRVCDCCNTAMAMASGGPVIVYRDRSAADIRDISVVRWTPKGWSAPVAVHSDGWKLHGCPVNGPRVAAAGKVVAVAWFTGAPDPRVNVARSNDGGATFGPAVRIDEGHPAGRVDIALLADGSSIVSWVEMRGSAASVEARSLPGSGAPGPVAHLGSLPAANLAGFPRLAVSKGRIVITWNGEQSVQVAAIH